MNTLLFLKVYGEPALVIKTINMSNELRYSLKIKMLIVIKTLSFITQPNDWSCLMVLTMILVQSSTDMCSLIKIHVKVNQY